MFKKLPLEKFYHLINHGPCVIISSGGKNRTNIAPIAWVMPLNDEPPLVAVAIAESHYTVKLIEEEGGEFVINVPDVKLLSSLIGAGKISGHQIDKIKKFKPSLEDSVKIHTPHLKDSLGWIECKVVDKKNYDGVILFVGKVLYCAIEESVYKEGEGFEPLATRPTAHHLSGKWFGVITQKIKLPE